MSSNCFFSDINLKSCILLLVFVKIQKKIKLKFVICLIFSIIMLKNILSIFLAKGFLFST